MMQGRHALAPISTRRGRPVAAYVTLDLLACWQPAVVTIAMAAATTSAPARVLRAILSLFIGGLLFFTGQTL
jgi:zinc transporter ZupT